MGTLLRGVFLEETSGSNSLQRNLSQRGEGRAMTLTPQSQRNNLKMRLCESILKTLGPHCALYLRRTDSPGSSHRGRQAGGATGFLEQRLCPGHSSQAILPGGQGQGSRRQGTGQRGPSASSMSSEKAGNFLSGLGGMGLLWGLFHSLFTHPTDPPL